MRARLIGYTQPRIGCLPHRTHGGHDGFGKSV